MLWFMREIHWLSFDKDLASEGNVRCFQCSQGISTRLDNWYLGRDFLFCVPVIVYIKGYPYMTTDELRKANKKLNHL